MPSAKEKAQTGVQLLKEAIFEFVCSHPEGVTHAMIVTALNLETDFEGTHKNYLSWSVLGLLVNEGCVCYKGSGQGKRYFPIRNE